MSGSTIAVSDKSVGVTIESSETDKEVWLKAQLDKDNNKAVSDVELKLAKDILQSLDPKAFEDGGNLKGLTGDAFIDALTPTQFNMLVNASQYDGDATLSANDLTLAKLTRPGEEESFQKKINKLVDEGIIAREDDGSLSAETIAKLTEIATDKDAKGNVIDTYLSWTDVDGAIKARYALESSKKEFIDNQYKLISEEKENG
jgi:hypothetical protein